MDKVIGVLEIDGGIDTGFTCSGKEVGNEWKRILILFGDFIEALVVYAEVEGFVFLESEDYWSTMGGGTLADKSGLEMVIEELQRTSSSDWERGYIGTIGGEVPSSKLILRS